MIIFPLFSNFQVTEVQTVNVLTAHTRAVSQLALHADRKSVAVCGVSAQSQPQTTAANSGTFMHQLTLTVSMRELQSHSIMENHRSMDYIDLLEVHHLACICTSFQH